MEPLGMYSFLTGFLWLQGDFRDALGAVVTYRRVYGKYG